MLVAVLMAEYVVQLLIDSIQSVGGSTAGYTRP